MKKKICVKSRRAQFVNLLPKKAFSKPFFNEKHRMQHVSAADLADMETRRRAAFVNSLGGFKSVALIGSADSAGQTNLAIFNSIVHLGANPPLVGMIFRPDSTERHTLENILETGCWTVSHLTSEIFERAHQTSARYPRGCSEFEAVGLEPLFEPGFSAPFVAASRVRFALDFRQKIDLEINGTSLVIGQIAGVWLPNGAILADGFVDLEAAGSLACSGLDSYHETKRLARMAYAKPDLPPRRL